MFLFVITINNILILSNRDFLEIRIGFLGSNAIIKEGEKIIRNEEFKDLRTNYLSVIIYLSP